MMTSQINELFPRNDLNEAQKGELRRLIDLNDESPLMGQDREQFEALLDLAGPCNAA